jgi:DNA-binding Xre family transcriptional regulator
MKAEFPQEITQSLDHLRALILSNVTNQSEISKATGIDQSQISRILAGKVKRVSKNMLELCKFARNLPQIAERDPSQSPALMSALKAVWDGTPEHAAAIASVVLSLRKFREV